MKTQTILFLFVLLVLNVSAVSILPSDDGLVFDNAKLAIGLNAQKIPKTSLVTSWDQVDYDTWKYGFNITNPFGALQASKVKNVTLTWVFDKPVQQVGSGLLQADSGPIQTLWGFADVYETCQGYGLTCTESMSDTRTYQIVVSGFAGATSLNGVYEFDPTIQEGLTNTWVLGAFNNTKSTTFNPAMASISGNYYNDTKAWIGNGTFWSKAFITTTGTLTKASSVQYLNWSWYEPFGLSDTESILADWHLEGETTDASINNYTMRLGNTTAITNPTFNASCFIGGCYQMTGRQFLRSLRQDLWIPNGTATAWVKRINTTAMSGRFEAIVGQTSGGTAGTESWFMDWYTAGAQGVLRCSISNGTGTIGATQPYNFTANTWTFVACTWNASDAILYINDTPVGKTIGKNNASAQFQPASILIGAEFSNGASPNPNYMWNGSIDEVHLWNRSLSQNEISQVYDWENGGGEGNQRYIQNFTNVTLALRTKNYSFDNTFLVSWFDFGDTTDNETITNKSVGIGSPTSIFNGKIIVDPQGVIGNALDFNGESRSYFTLPSWGSLGLVGETAFIWVKPAPDDLIGNKSIIGSSSLASYYGMNLVDGYFHCWMTNPFPNTYSFNTTVKLNANQWYHLGCVNSGSNTAAFVNGVNVGTKVGGPGVGPSYQTAFIGYDNFYSGNRYWNGSIDDLKIFNDSTYVLEAAMAAQLYNGGTPTNASGPETNWTAWTQDYTGGNATVLGVIGDLIQYRATFQTTSDNFTPFLRYVNITYANLTLPTNLTWSQNQTSTTNVGSPAIFSLYWVSSTYPLVNYAMEIDNGDGVHYNITDVFQFSMTGWSNETITLNSTLGTNVTWRVFAYDQSGSGATSPWFYLNTTQAPSLLAICPNGDYLANQPNQLLIFTNANITCTATIYNNTGWLTATNQTTDWIAKWENLTINYDQTKAGHYYAAVNCSNGLNVTKEFNLVTACYSPVLLQTKGGESMPIFDFGIIGWLTVIGALLLIVGAYGKNAMLLGIASVVFLTTGMLYFQPALGVQQYTQTNQTISVVLNNQGMLSNATLISDDQYTPLQNDATGGLGLINILLGVGLLAFAIQEYVSIRAFKKKESRDKETEAEE